MGRRARALRRHRHRHALRVRAQSEVADSAPPGHHSARPRAGVGIERGQHLSRRARPRAAAVSSSGPRMGQIPHADSRTSTCAARRPILAAASWARQDATPLWKSSAHPSRLRRRGGAIDRRHLRRRRAQRAGGCHGSGASGPEDSRARARDLLAAQRSPTSSTQDSGSPRSRTRRSPPRPW